jgi:polyphosphate kinase
VDRFVEHSRLFYFENACQPEIWLGSGDWTPASFSRRIEVLFPIEDGNLRERIRGQILDAALGDNVKARFLQPDGSYKRARVPRGTALRRSQHELLQTAARSETTPASAKTKALPPRFKLAPNPFAAQRT